MYSIPKDLDLSAVVGQFTTQLRVGQYDIHMTFGDVSFAVTSPIELRRDGKPYAYWEEGRWPDPGFYEIMNSDVARCQIIDEKTIVIAFENGIEMILSDSSHQYESITITFSGDPCQIII